MGRIRFPDGQIRILFLQTGGAGTAWGRTPFWAGLRLRYPPQKFLVILEIDICGNVCLCPVHGPKAELGDGLT